MTKRIKNITLQKGKGFRKISTLSSIVGAPNSNIDFYDLDSGKLIMRRKINNFGLAQKDLDKWHITLNSQDHAHDYVNKKRDKERPLSKKEKRELIKASRKRRIT